MGDMSNFEGLFKNDVKVILKEGERWEKVVKMGKNRGKNVECRTVNDVMVGSLNPQC